MTVAVQTNEKNASLFYQLYCYFQGWNLHALGRII